MDITTVFGTVVPGSNPGGSTNKTFTFFCDPTASRLREMRQDSNTGSRDSLFRVKRETSLVTES